MTHSALGSSCRYAMASTTSQLITSAAAAPTVARYNVLRSSGTSLRAAAHHTSLTGTRSTCAMSL
jgi:hypothetical protein